MTRKVRTYDDSTGRQQVLPAFGNSVLLRDESGNLNEVLVPDGYVIATVPGQSLAPVSPVALRAQIVNAWRVKLTGAGPHTLISSRLNRYDDSALAGMILHAAAVPAHGEEFEVKEVGGSVNPVTLTTAAGTDNFETPAGTIAFTVSLVTARAWLKYKWDSDDSVWRVIGKAFL